MLGRMNAAALHPRAISPELALVSTELREAALQLLPDRDPYAFLERPAVTKRRRRMFPLWVAVLAYVLLQLVWIGVFGVAVIATLVGSLLLVGIFA